MNAVFVLPFDFVSKRDTIPICKRMTSFVFVLIQRKSRKNLELEIVFKTF